MQDRAYPLDQLESTEPIHQPDWDDSETDNPEGVTEDDDAYISNRRAPELVEYIGMHVTLWFALAIILELIPFIYGRPLHFSVGALIVVGPAVLVGRSSGEFPTTLSNYLFFLGIIGFPSAFLNFWCVRGIEPIRWLREKQRERDVRI